MRRPRLSPGAAGASSGAVVSECAIMRRGAWLGALALGLGGWLGGAAGQQAVWRPVTRPPQHARTARAVSRDPASPGLGRPIAVAPHSVADNPPAPFPPDYRA